MKMLKVLRKYTKIKTCFLLVVLSVLIQLSCGRQAVNGNPIIQISETEIDLGSVNRTTDMPIIYKVKINNQGDGNLILKRLYTDCEICSSVEVKDTLVKPGKTIEAKITFDFTNLLLGETFKTVFIDSNDENNPCSEIQFKANIIY